MGITEKRNNKHKKVIIGTIISFCILLAIYIGMAIFFMNHFYFGSEINGINVSGKTVEKVNELMETKLQEYSLHLKERGGKTEEIKGSEVGLKYTTEGEFNILKAKQRPFKWITAMFKSEYTKMLEGITFDEGMLKGRVDQLACFESGNITEPKNAGFKYADNSYVIVEEVAGNKINKDILIDHMKDAVLKGETILDLDAIDCYIKPQYTSKSPEIIEAKDKLNKYVSSKVTYTFGEKKEIVDSAVISKWINVDDKLVVTFDEEKAKNYINELANTYNTIGKTRSFMTSSGNTINIGGGDYGWAINKAKEAQDLIAAIKEGQSVTKAPVYLQTAFSNGNSDIGNTYVEINISKQHLWFYKNGSLIAQGDVVTGNVSSNHSTPKGVYKLKYKQKNAVLRGPGYAAPVSFWMPFNGGIGIHDASWRSSFGGNIYKTNGSHGCVNSPYNLAKTIFDNIVEGTPVICYY